MARKKDIVSLVYREDYQSLSKHLSPSNINETDEMGRTPLMHAVLATPPSMKMIQYLIDHGANAGAVDLQGWTALHFAARDQQKEIVDMLLVAGVPVDPLDLHGNSPLWRCVMNSEPNLDIVKRLLKSGADPSLVNRHGSSPLDVAKDDGNTSLVSLLAKGMSKPRRETGRPKRQKTCTNAHKKSKKKAKMEVRKKRKKKAPKKAKTAAKKVPKGKSRKKIAKKK